jgi:hypothetical protein
MINDKYIYSQETKSLKQWIERPEPSGYTMDFDGSREYESDMKEWERKRSTLPTIQAEGLNLDKDCELVEGKDFRLQHQVDVFDYWHDIPEHEYNQLPHYANRQITALPIHSVDTPSQQQISKVDLEDFKILEEYDMKDKLAGTIRHALTKVPESNRENFIVNLCNGMIGSAILHYRNRHEKKLDVKPFKEQFK